MKNRICSSRMCWTFTSALGVLGLAVLALAGCSVYNFSTPVGEQAGLTEAQRNEAQRTMPRPQLRADVDHTWVEAEKTYPVPRGEFLTIFREMPLDELVEPTDELAPVEKIVSLEGEWVRPNARRRIELADGTSFVEQLLTYGPDGFSYMLWNFTSEARHGVTYATGRWYITEIEGGTHVLWRYGLVPRSGLTQGAVNNFANNIFLPFMQAGLDNIAEAVERKTNPGDEN